MKGFTLTNGLAWEGGGASGGTLNHCTLTGNSAHWGGGAWRSRMNNCIITSNSARGEGGGAAGGTLNSCTLTGNSADYGGGASAGVYPMNTSVGTLNNCTVTGNSARTYGGGISSNIVNNCIVYYNSAPQDDRIGDNHYMGRLNYSCTTPLPTNGTGNITAEPQLASPSHLSPTSPCRGAGVLTNVQGEDIDGEPWASVPSIGCDEYWPDAVNGPLTVAIIASYTNVAVGFPVEFSAQIDGRPTDSRWEFDDGSVLSNRPYASRAWAAPGDCTVVLRAYNESQPGGIAAKVIVHVMAVAHYVWLGSPNPVSPYSSWSNAAWSIQAAVDVAVVPGAVVWVTNGLYETGGRVV